MEIITIETKALGDRSSVVAAGSGAAVVDPQRDIDRALTELEDRIDEVPREDAGAWDRRDA